MGIPFPALKHTTHTPKAEWKSDANNHWHECTGCEGQELDKAAHADADTNGKCDTCEYDMPVVTPDPDPDPAPDPDPDPSDEKDGLSGGAIAGIVVGSVLVVGAGGFSIFWFVVQKKSATELVTVTKALCKQVGGRIKDVTLNLVEKIKKLFAKK